MGTGTKKKKKKKTRTWRDLHRRIRGCFLEKRRKRTCSKKERGGLFAEV